MHKRFIWLVSCFSLLLLGAGCISVPALPSVSSTQTQPIAVATSTTLTWEKISVGFERAETTFSSTTGSIIVLYRFSPKQFEAQLMHELPPKHISVWGAEATGTELLVNGVYFHEDYLPSGFFQTSGTRIGTRQFDQDKSGLLIFNPFQIIDTKIHPTKLGGAPMMAQSYPFLLKNGMLAVQNESGKVARRTFVGIDRQGMIYVGVAPYAPLSLLQLGQFLSQLPLSWNMVLNLDGGPSTGLWMHHGARSELFDSYVPVPNILSIRPRSIKP